MKLLMTKSSGSPETIPENKGFEEHRVRRIKGPENQGSGESRFRRINNPENQWSGESKVQNIGISGSRELEEGF